MSASENPEDVTKPWLIGEAMRAYNAAMRAGQASAAKNCLELFAKLTGILVERKESDRRSNGLIAGCTNFPHGMVEKASFVRAYPMIHMRPDLNPRGGPVVAALTHPIAWLLESLRLWRTSKSQVAANEPVDHGETADLYHERNATYWCLLPPC
jgi:hypothetical protein